MTDLAEPYTAEDLDPGDLPPAAPAPASGSLQEFLRAKHQEKAEEIVEPLTLAVRGLDGAFGIRYEFPRQGIDAILKLGDRMQSKEKLAQLNAAIGVILASYTEIVGRLPGEDWDRPLGSAPLRFGDELVNILQLDLEGVKARARFVCRNLFSPHARVTNVYDGDLVLIEHAGEVMDWLRKANEEADEALAGE